MPIRPLLEADSGAFGPEEIRAITNAFEAALGSLGLVNPSDPMVMIVAKTTLALAKQGERDPLRLSELVIRQMAT
jgi:hypothetical protein